MTFQKNITALTKVATDYISIADLKEHLAIESSNTDHDSYLADMLPACFDVADGILGFCSRKSTVEYLFNDVEYTSSGGVVLHIPARLMSITSVKYLDSTGAEQTMVAGTDYQQLNSFNSAYGCDIHLINLPSNPYEYGWKYKVTAVEGWEPVSANPTNKSFIFPDRVLQGIKLIAGQYWSERMAVNIGVSVSEMPYNHVYLISKYKISQFA